MGRTEEISVKLNLDHNLDKTSHSAQTLDRYLTNLSNKKVKVNVDDSKIGVAEDKVEQYADSLSRMYESTSKYMNDTDLTKKFAEIDRNMDKYGVDTAIKSVDRMVKGLEGLSLIFGDQGTQKLFSGVDTYTKAVANILKEGSKYQSSISKNVVSQANPSLSSAKKTDLWFDIQNKALDEFFAINSKTASEMFGQDFDDSNLDNRAMVIAYDTLQEQAKNLQKLFANKNNPDYQWRYDDAREFIQTIESISTIASEMSSGLSGIQMDGKVDLNTLSTNFQKLLTDKNSAFGKIQNLLPESYRLNQKHLLFGEDMALHIFGNQLNDYLSKEGIIDEASQLYPNYLKSTQAMKDARSAIFKEATKITGQKYTDPDEKLDIKEIAARDYEQYVSNARQRNHIQAVNANEGAWAIPEEYEDLWAYNKSKAKVSSNIKTLLRQFSVGSTYNDIFNSEDEAVQQLAGLFGRYIGLNPDARIESLYDLPELDRFINKQDIVDAVLSKYTNTYNSVLSMTDKQSELNQIQQTAYDKIANRRRYYKNENQAKNNKKLEQDAARIEEERLQQTEINRKIAEQEVLNAINTVTNDDKSYKEVNSTNKAIYTNLKTALAKYAEIASSDYEIPEQLQNRLTEFSSFLENEQQKQQKQQEIESQAKQIDDIVSQLQNGDGKASDLSTTNVSVYEQLNDLLARYKDLSGEQYALDSSFTKQINGIEKFKENQQLIAEQKQQEQNARYEQITNIVSSLIDDQNKISPYTQQTASIYKQLNALINTYNQNKTEQDKDLSLGQLNNELKKIKDNQEPELNITTADIVNRINSIISANNLQNDDGKFVDVDEKNKQAFETILQYLKQYEKEYSDANITGQLPFNISQINNALNSFKDKQQQQLIQNNKKEEELQKALEIINALEKQIMDENGEVQPYAKENALTYNQWRDLVYNYNKNFEKGDSRRVPISRYPEALQDIYKMLAPAVDKQGNIKTDDSGNIIRPRLPEEIDTLAVAKVKTPLTKLLNAHTNINSGELELHNARNDLSWMEQVEKLLQEYEQLTGENYQDTRLGNFSTKIENFRNYVKKLDEKQQQKQEDAIIAKENAEAMKRVDTLLKEANASSSANGNDNSGNDKPNNDFKLPENFSFEQVISAFRESLMQAFSGENAIPISIKLDENQTGLRDQIKQIVESELSLDKLGEIAKATEKQEPIVNPSGNAQHLIKEARDLARLYDIGEDTNTYLDDYYAQQVNNEAIRQNELKKIVDNRIQTQEDLDKIYQPLFDVDEWQEGNDYMLEMHKGYQRYLQSEVKNKTGITSNQDLTPEQRADLTQMYSQLFDKAIANQEYKEQFSNPYQRALELENAMNKPVYPTAGLNSSKEKPIDEFVQGLTEFYKQEQENAENQNAEAWVRGNDYLKSLWKNNRTGEKYYKSVWDQTKQPVVDALQALKTKTTYQAASKNPEGYGVLEKALDKYEMQTGEKYQLPKIVQNNLDKYKQNVEKQLEDELYNLYDLEDKSAVVNTTASSHENLSSTPRSIKDIIADRQLKQNSEAWGNLIDTYEWQQGNNYMLERHKDYQRTLDNIYQPLFDQIDTNREDATAKVTEAIKQIINPDGTYKNVNKNMDAYEELSKWLNNYYYATGEEYTNLPAQLAKNIDKYKTKKEEQQKIQDYTQLFDEAIAQEYERNELAAEQARISEENYQKQVAQFRNKQQQKIRQQELDDIYQPFFDQIEQNNAKKEAEKQAQALADNISYDGTALVKNGEFTKSFQNQMQKFSEDSSILFKASSAQAKEDLGIISNENVTALITYNQQLDELKQKMQLVKDIRGEDDSLVQQILDPKELNTSKGYSSTIASEVNKALQVLDNSKLLKKYTKGQAYGNLNLATDEMTEQTEEALAKIIKAYSIIEKAQSLGFSLSDEQQKIFDNASTASLQQGITEQEEKAQKLVSVVNNVKQAYEEIKRLKSGLGLDNQIENTGIIIQSLQDKMVNTGNVANFEKQAQRELQKLSSMTGSATTAEEAMTRMRDNFEGFDNIKFDTANNGLNDVITATATFVDESNQLHTVQQVWGETGNAIVQSTKSIKENVTALDSFRNIFQGKWKEFAAFLATKASFYQVFAQIKQGLGIVKQLDDALTEMNKVSDEPLSVLRTFQKESYSIANEIGSTGLQIQQSTADFMRLGESLNEAKESARVSNILLNVSEFKSIDQATESLIAMHSAYKDISEMDIVDKLNNIGNNFSISTDGIASALQRSAASLTNAGNDIDEAIALITAGNAVVQDPEAVGAGLRTIALRIQGTDVAKRTLEEEGEDVTDYVVSNVVGTTSKLNEKIKQLTAVESNNFQGVSLLDRNGNYRSTYEILQDIADVYEEIGEMDKKYGTNHRQGLLETLAGKTRSNIAASILANPEMLREVYESSQNSEGSALEENQKYLDSISGHIDQIKNKWQEAWAGTANRDQINFFIDLGSAILDVVDKVGLLQSAGLLATGYGLLLSPKAGKQGRQAFSQLFSMPFTDNIAKMSLDKAGLGGATADQTKAYLDALSTIKSPSASIEDIVSTLKTASTVDGTVDYKTVGKLLQASKAKSSVVDQVSSIFSAEEDALQASADAMSDASQTITSATDQIAEGMATAAQGTVSLTTATTAMISAFAPFAIIGGTILALGAAYKIAEKNSHKFVDSLENASNAYTDYNTALNDIKNKQSQLDENNAYISDYRKRESQGEFIPYEEQAEYNKLLRETLELQNELSIAQQQANVVSSDVLNNARQALEARNTLDYTQREVDNLGGLTGNYVTEDILTATENELSKLQELKDERNDLLNQLGRATDATEKESLQKAIKGRETLIDEYNGYLTDNIAHIQQMTSLYRDADGNPLKDLTSADKDSLERMELILEGYGSLDLSEQEKSVIALDKFFSGSKSKQAFKRQLADIANSSKDVGEITTDLFKALQQFGLTPKDLGISSLDELRKYLQQTKEETAALNDELDRMDFDGSLESVDKAFESANQGAKYDTRASQWKQVQEMYEKGLVGTDDFQAFVQSMTRGKIDTSKYEFASQAYVEAYKAQVEKLNRYYTEDPYDGMINFMDDLMPSGLVTQGDDGGYRWSKELKDSSQVAKQLGLSLNDAEVLMDKMREYGMEIGDINWSGKNLTQFKSTLDSLREVYDNMSEGSEKKKLGKLIEGYDEQVAKLEADLGELSEEQIIRIQFEYDLATLQSELAEARRKWEIGGQTEEQGREVLYAEDALWQEYQNQGLTNELIQNSTRFNSINGQINEAQDALKTANALGDKTLINMAQNRLMDLMGIRNAFAEDINKWYDLSNGITAEDLSHWEDRPDGGKTVLAIDTKIDTVQGYEAINNLIDSFNASSVITFTADVDGVEKEVKAFKEEDGTITYSIIGEDGEGHKVEFDKDNGFFKETDLRVDAQGSVADYQEKQVVTKKREETESVTKKVEERKVDIKGNASKELEGIQNKSDNIDGRTLKVLEAVESDSANAKIDETQQKADELDNTTSEVDLEAQDNASPKIETTQKAVDDFHGKKAEATLEAKDDSKSVISNALSALTNFGKSGKIVTLSARDNASGVARNATALMNEFGRSGKTVTATATTKGLGDVKTLKAEIDKIHDRLVTITVQTAGVDFARKALAGIGVRVSGTMYGMPSSAYAGGSGWAAYNLSPAHAVGTNVALTQDEEAVVNEVG